MPGHSLATSTARPAQRSLVVLHPIGYVKAGTLLLWVRRILVRGTRPQRLTSGREALLLELLGARQGQPVETILLGSSTACQYWLRLLKYRAFA